MKKKKKKKLNSLTPIQKVALGNCSRELFHISNIYNSVFLCFTCQALNCSSWLLRYMNC